MKPRLRHSATLYSTFTSCERRAFLDQLYKHEEEESPAMVEGRRVHGILEHMANERIKTGAWPDVAEGRLLRLEDSGFFDEIIPTSAEEWIRELRWNGEAIEWCGKVDLQTEHVVLDYKVTGNPNRVLSPREAKRSIQLGAYCLATGKKSAEFVYILPNDVQRVAVTFSDEELDRWFRWFKMEGEVIRARWEALDENCESWDRVFALAPPDYFLCSAKWCRHWHRCIGKE